MGNTSATGGYLAPAGKLTKPLTDSALQDVLHDWIAGITGTPNQMVRPRFQPEPSNIPENGVDWCAFGIVDKEIEGQPFVQHYPSSVEFPNGYDESRSHERFVVMVTFYGPNAEYKELLLSKGLYIPQNLEGLNQYNIALVGHGTSSVVPEFVKEQWVYRVDLPIEFRRQIVLHYEVQNILSSNPTINNEHTTG